jgi:transposase-like protein
MPSPPRVDWPEIRRFYADSNEPVAAIARRLGVAPRAIYDRARKDGWPRRADRRKPPDAPSQPEAPPLAMVDVPAGLAQRRALVRRLYRAIDTKLKVMELRMEKELTSSSKPVPSSADHERDTRAIATLIKTLESVTELEIGLDRASGETTGNAAAGPDNARALADEADRFRRELAERLQRLTSPPA